jgi:hypothetical protein
MQRNGSFGGHVQCEAIRCVRVIYWRVSRYALVLGDDEKSRDSETTYAESDDPVG